MNSSRRHLAATGLYLALVTALAICIAPGARAATDEPVVTPAQVAVVQQPAAPLPELGTIWVHGKKLMRSIVDSEDDFFSLYNKVNRNHDFDIECGYASLERGSMIVVRKCVPSFLLDAQPQAGYVYRESNFAIAGAGYSGGFGGMIGTGGCDGFGSRSVYGEQYGTYYQSSPNYCTSAFISPMSAAPQPPPALVLMARRDEYRNNVIDVINSNPALLEKYDHLVGLYHELDAVQSRYHEARQVRHRNVKPSLGPRVQQ